MNRIQIADLNSMQLDEPKPLVQINSKDNKNYEIQLVPNMGQDLLATGPRYMNDMLRIVPAHQLGYHSSGVLGKILLKYIFDDQKLIDCYF